MKIASMKKDLMKPPVEKLLDEQLNGLLIPPDNTLFSWETGLGLIFLSLCILSTIVFLVLRYQHNRQKPAVAATRKLKALQNSHPTDQQSTAIAITQILRQGLTINRLDEYQSNDQNEKNTWKAFTTQLNKACYSANSTEEITLTHLFNESHGWLSKAIIDQCYQPNQSETSHA